jgi:hypothetical protein
VEESWMGNGRSKPVLDRGIFRTSRIGESGNQIAGQSSSVAMGLSEPLADKVPVSAIVSTRQVAIQLFGGHTAMGQQRMLPTLRDDFYKGL